MCQLEAFMVNEYFQPNALSVLQFKIDSTFRIQITFEKDLVFKTKVCWFELSLAKT